jgi:hypothetical protein
MGTRKQRGKQEDIWVAHAELASAPGHPFYQRLNELLARSEAVRHVCRRALREVLHVPIWAAVADPRHLLPVAVDRLFEGIDSERNNPENDLPSSPYLNTTVTVAA